LSAKFQYGYLPQENCHFATKFPKQKIIHFKAVAKISINKAMFLESKKRIRQLADKNQEKYLTKKLYLI
jgi:hypothetical protein